VSAWLDVIGVTEGGLADLPPALAALVSRAEAVLGPARFDTGDARFVAWTTPLPAMLAQIEARRGRSTVILATGDPNWFGIGSTLAARLAPGEMRLFPAPSAFQLAAARLGWPLQSIATLSLHGRPVEMLHPHLTPGNRVLALTADRATLPAVRDLLARRGYAGSMLSVLENLGGREERLIRAPARDFDAAIGDFYVLGIDCAADPGAPLLAPVPGLPDAAFLSDGQLTKSEVRAITLCALAPFPGALLWDVGAGCGSVGIEWMRAARGARAIAFENNAERLGLIAANAAALGAPALSIMPGRAPDSLAGRPSPDAIFIGGAVADEALFSACWAALRPGGRLVANAVTLEGEAALFAREARFGGQLRRIDIARLERVGAQRVLRPKLPVTQWAVTRPERTGP
jgi:precorrin-6Y C5,15-methyltransferase (decarboxylating)